MTMVTYNPWKVLNELHSELERWSGAAANDNSDVVTSQWMPAVDIKEEADRFILYADLPGVDPEDIELTMEKGVLSIKGERQIEKAEEGERLSRIERRHGVFHRRFALPDSADAQKIEAHGKLGVLEIFVPKRAHAQARRIAVAA